SLPSTSQIRTSRVCGSAKRDVRIWDVEGKEAPRTIGTLARPAPGGFARFVVLGAQYSPDGKRLLTPGFEKTLRVWDVETGRELAMWTGHNGPVGAATWSPDGKLAASGGDDGLVKIWDAQTGRE